MFKFHMEIYNAQNNKTTLKNNKKGVLVLANIQFYYKAREIQSGTYLRTYKWTNRNRKRPMQHEAVTYDRADITLM